jgi:hypothetical protein
VMAHGPVILPAIAGIKLAYDKRLYVPLALLHGSVALRVAVVAAAPQGLPAAAVLNVAALALFALAAVDAARRWRRHHNHQRMTS